MVESEKHMCHDGLGAMSGKLAIQDIVQINQEMETASPGKILAWAWDIFGEGLVVSSSFQTQSIPLLHVISQVVPQVPVMFVDTGFHFPETLQFRDRLVEQFCLNLVVVKPAIYGQEFVDTFGPLYAQTPDACCFHNKVVPFQLRLKEYSAWVTGIRRDQTVSRKNAPVVGQHPFLAVFKISPMVNWSSKDIDAYIAEHDLPRHPLWELGYRSIGCQPCTVPVRVDENDRNGRWPHRDKSECGVHTL
jgi:phosphoadenosine phosphosulfate reductase